MSECLAKEVSPFGIEITVLEPGQFRTDFFNKGKTQIKESDKPDYKQLVDHLTSNSLPSMAVRRVARNSQQTPSLN